MAGVASLETPDRSLWFHMTAGPAVTVSSRLPGSPRHWLSRPTGHRGPVNAREIQKVREKMADFGRVLREIQWGVLWQARAGSIAGISPAVDPTECGLPAALDQWKSSPPPEGNSKNSGGIFYTPQVVIHQAGRCRRPGHPAQGCGETVLARTVSPTCFPGVGKLSEATGPQITCGRSSFLPSLADSRG